MRPFWLLSALVSLPLASALSAQPLYHIKDLGPGHAFGLNDSAQVVGVFGGKGAVWSEQTGFVELPLPTGLIGPTAFPTVINNSGQIAGYVIQSVTSLPHAHFWNGATAQPVSIYGFAVPSAINSLGVVVGIAPSFPPSGNWYWSWHDGNLQPFPVELQVFDINDAGVAVGSMLVSDHVGHAMLWRDGIVLDLGTLPGSEQSRASAINNAGVVVGESGGEAFMWAAESGMVAIGPGAATRINDRNWVLGTYFVPVGTAPSGLPAFEARTSLWRPGMGVADLATLVYFPGSGFSDLGSVQDIDSSGRIVGVAIFDNGPRHAYLLVPIPEPEAWTFAAVGGACLLVALRRRVRSVR
jgi:hypothetical protein